MNEQTIHHALRLLGKCMQCPFFPLHTTDIFESNAGIGVDVHVHRISNRLGWNRPPTKTPEETRYVELLIIFVNSSLSD